MAATSYTTLPFNSYVGLGSQGNLLHSANFGTYDTGVGSITSHPYDYQTANYSTHHQQPSYSEEFLRTTRANDTHSTQQPQHYSPDRSAHQSTHNQDPSLKDSRYDEGRSTIPNVHEGNHSPYRTHTDNHQHQTSHPDTTHHHRLPPPVENQQHYPPAPVKNQQHRPPPPPVENQHHQHSPSTNNVRSEQDSFTHPSPPKHQQRHSSPSKHHSQPNQVRSDHQAPKQPPTVHHQSPSNSINDSPSAATTKSHPPPSERKTTKSTQMRAAAIKQKEETREQKRKNGTFPALNKKSTPPKTQPKQKPAPPTPSDDDQSEQPKNERNKKSSKSLSKQHKSRRNDYHTEDNNSSAEEDHHGKHPRSKSKKRTAFSDSRHEKYPPLPPVRRGRGPTFYEPYDYPYPPRGRHPYYDDYPPYGSYPHPGRYDYHHRHLYEDAHDGPPYVAGYHDPYDGFFDYERRKGKSRTKGHKDKKEPTTDHEDRDAVTGNETERDDDAKSVQSKKTKSKKKPSKGDDDENGHQKHPRERWPPNYYDAPHYNEDDALEIWRQERNDYLKKTYKPTVHDVLYSQQWMKSDSYLENQRRRALRDTQGYYFPYKKYTLKDYKDLQKQEEQYNPYAAIPEPTLDRKERAKKRQEYASNIERQPADTFSGQQKTPRDMPPRKPWHLSNVEPADSDKLSKRERALEYAKVQVVKHRPQRAPKNRGHQPDPTEQYVNSLFPQTNDDDGSVNGRDHQSNDEYDE